MNLKYKLFYIANDHGRVSVAIKQAVVAIQLGDRVYRWFVGFIILFGKGRQALSKRWRSNHHCGKMNEGEIICKWNGNVMSTGGKLWGERFAWRIYYYLLNSVWQCKMLIHIWEEIRLPISPIRNAKLIKPPICDPCEQYVNNMWSMLTNCIFSQICSRTTHPPQNCFKMLPHAALQFLPPD